MRVADSPKAMCRVAFWALALLVLHLQRDEIRKIAIDVDQWVAVHLGNERVSVSTERDGRKPDFRSRTMMGEHDCPQKA